jgi:hypothetical protein
MEEFSPFLEKLKVDMKSFFFLGLTMIVGLFSEAQPTKLKCGTILHYKATVIINEDSTNAIEIKDFQIKIDTIIQFNKATTLIVFSNYFDSIYNLSSIEMKTLFLFQGQKVYKIDAGNPWKFIQDYSANFSYWNRKVKDTLKTAISYSNTINHVYNFIPFFNLKNKPTCKNNDSLEEAGLMNAGNNLTFACFEEESLLNILNHDEKVNHYVIYPKRAVYDYYYSKKYGIVKLTSQIQIQDRFYEANFSLYKIE